MQKTVAYIIVCWNNKDIIEECISSIIEQTHDDKKIIVIDNNSNDGSPDFIRKKFSNHVEVLEMSDNLGFAKANNVGIEHALSDHSVKYVALLNSDARLKADWTTTIVNFADKKPLGAAFQTITLDYYNHKIIDSTHIYVARNMQGTQGSWRQRLPNNNDVAPQKVFGCNAAAVIYSRKFIEEQPFNDFFDETMFMYLEDVDVAARATVMGWDNYVVPGSRAYHMGSASSGKNPGFSLYMTYRNNLGMVVKNFPIPILIRCMPKMIIADYHTVKRLLFLKQRRGVINLLKGRALSFVYLPVYLNKRRKISRRVDSVHLYKLMGRGI